MIDLLTQLRTLAKNKFNEAIEIAINTNIDAKKTEQAIRGVMLLPNVAIEKKRFIVAITDEKNIDADLVGLHDVVDAIKNGQVKAIDRCITTPAYVNIIKPISALLGRKGLMPNKKFNTLTDNIHVSIKDAKVDLYFKSDKSGIVHLIVGRLNMPDEQIIENIKYVLANINRSFNDVAQTKVQNKITSVYLSTTQSVGSVAIDNYQDYI